MASGGSGGGGKIRIRRHHLGAGKPPYTRGKQQLGLISRVTESVKNIVPGWLQKYFNKREDKCVDTNESPNQEEHPVNYHHDYANEDATVIDGRVTPESARINLEEPSTSRSALNFSDVLTRPSLHRSHLNCTVLDPTVPHCQPSTSSALGIGSPGLSLVKEIKDSTSQHDDDNISTTSGFSSRASDKDVTVSKNTSAPLLWSPEAERSHSLSQHPASTSKKPAFNLSAFGSPSPSLGNTSVFKTRQLGDSPFYPGKTSYGGAAAAARQTKVQISAYQPVDRSVLNMTSFQSRQNQDMTQESFPAEKPVKPSESNLIYPKPDTPASNGLSSGGRMDSACGKMRRERERYSASKSGQKQQPQIKFTFSVPVAKSAELSGSVDTPVTSLFSPGSTTVNSTSNKKEEEEEYDGLCKPAKFLKQGSVLDILKSPGKDTSKQASSFWQSDTCDPCLQNKTTDGKCVTCEAAEVSTVESTKQTISVSQCVSSKTAVPTAGTLGFEDKFKPAPNTWECDTCLVQNKLEATKCIACETPKPGTGVMPALTMPVVTDNSVTVTSSSSSTGTTVTLGFGDKFKQPKGSWNCSVCLVPNKAEDSKCVACQSEKAGSSVPVTSSSGSAFSASSGGFLDLDKFKRPEGSWECEVCLVQNKAEATKCAACENAKPGTKAELKGFGTAAVSTNAATPSFTFGVPSSSSESSQTLGSTGNFKFGEQSSFKFGIASESASSNTVTGGFKFPTGSGNFKFGVSSSDSKSEDSKKESKSNNFTFGLPSTTSQAPSTFQFGTASLGQQEKKEEPVLGGFGFGSSSTSSIATSENKSGVSGFTFGTVAEKEVASPALPFKKSDEKKDETVSVKGGFSFGSAESAPASQFVLGRAEEKQDSVTSAGPLAFGKKSDNEELKAQPIFSSGTAEHTKEESTAKPVFNFSFGKPPEKESEQAKPPFAFGAQTSTCDQGTSFSFLSSSSSSAVIPTTSANSSGMFGSTLSSSNPQPVPTPFVFGQPSNTVTSSVFGNPAESATSQSFGFSQENKPATTSSSTGSTPAPFLFGSGESSTNAANSGFTFGATTTSSSTGSSPLFLFGSGPSASAAGPPFGTSQPPAFGPSQGSSQPSAPSFGSLSSTLFSAGTQPAPSAFGSVTSSTQPSVFGQQATQQPGFGSGTPSAGSVFQFGSNTANFSFPNSPGVFTFGANHPAPAAPAQPSGTSGFSFNQTPTFTVGTNGKNVFSASGSSVAGRKIKTAVRRRK
ncbi:nuclear pore complex protein Nup153 [Pitangus sulphuratus]|nr:nuclear pore complex protein Nup153 [Pitangus sulphuratus]